MEVNHFSSSLFTRQNQLFCCGSRCSEEPLAPPSAAPSLAPTYSPRTFDNKEDLQNAIAEYATSKSGPPPNDWDVSRVRDFSELFFFNAAFNEDISAWDTSSVTNMGRMFRSASAFNQDISAWNVSSVTRMDDMFFFANAFNKDISDWDVSDVTDTNFMFQGASAFNQSLCSWHNKLPPGVAMTSMFVSTKCAFPGTPSLSHGDIHFCSKCKVVGI